MSDKSAEIRVLKGELLHDVINDVRYRVLYVSEESGTGYWISVDSASNIPKKIDLHELSLKLRCHSFEAIASSPVQEDKSEISPARAAERDRIYGLIKDIIPKEPIIYEPAGRAALLRKQEAETGIKMARLYNYLGRYWRGGMTPDTLLPKYNDRGAGPAGVSYTKRPGRPKKQNANGKILTAEDKKKFADAIQKFYIADTKPSLRSAYDQMIATMYTRPRFEGDTDPEQLSPDEKPSYRQFDYWHKKNRDIIQEQKGREAQRYDLNSRGTPENSDSYVKGPGMIVQIDATIADTYLVREHHRNEVIGRPVMFFVKDVKTRMIMGMYVTLENASWDSALMALKNTVEDKVEFCKRYGVTINPEDWPCHHLPVSITADNGEMGDKGVEDVIARLGVTIENTPPYRGDLKGIIEKNFDMVQMTLRYIVPGHADKDDGQRGAINRRKEACLDIKTFTQLIIRCVLYYNNYHYMNTYQKTPEMRRHNVRPIPRELWNYGMQFQSGVLRVLQQEDIYKILLPKDKASVTERGICFRELYYTCDKAKSECWFDKARVSGRWPITVSYDPSCLNHIYFCVEDGSLVRCDLLRKSSPYESASEEDMQDIHDFDEKEQADWEQAEEKAKTNLILETKAVVERCQKEKDDLGEETVGNVLNRHKLREQRKAEKEEQSGETAAKMAQADEAMEENSSADGAYESANDAWNKSIDEALKEAGLFFD